MKYSRLISLSKKRSFFLFGARNTGKNTLLLERLDGKTTFWVDLLDRSQEDRYARKPNEFYDTVIALPENVSHIVIDEIQKIPELIDEVHRLMMKTDKIFVMTSSSAKKCVLNELIS